MRHDAGLQEAVPSWKLALMECTVNGSALDVTVVCTFEKVLRSVKMCHNFQIGALCDGLTHRKIRLDVFPPYRPGSVF